jgi:hypothetical protein
MSNASPVYVVRLKPRPGVDGIRALRAGLKVLGRRFGLQALKVETAPHVGSDKSDLDHNAKGGNS